MSCSGVGASGNPWQGNQNWGKGGQPTGGGAPPEKPTGDSGDIGGPGDTAASTDPKTNAPAGSEQEKIAQGIEKIKQSAFAQTDKGKEVVAKLEEMQKNGDITVGDLGGNTAGLAGDGTLRLDDGLFTASGASNLESVMVHEAGHELQADHGLAVGHDAGPYSPDSLATAYENSI